MPAKLTWNNRTGLQRQLLANVIRGNWTGSADISTTDITDGETGNGGEEREGEKRREGDSLELLG